MGRGGLAQDFVGGGRAVSAAHRAGYRGGHASMDGFDLEGIFLTAGALNFDWDHKPGVLVVR